MVEKEKKKERVNIFFGQVLVDIYDRRQIIMDIGESNYFSCSTIMDEETSNERLGFPGTSSSYYIKEFLKESWPLQRIIDGYVKQIGEKETTRREITNILTKTARRHHRIINL